MLRTFQILIPTAALASITALGLSAIHYGGDLDIQLGPDRHIHIEGPERFNTH